MKTKTIFFLSPEVTGAERVSITMAKQLSKDEYDVVFAIIGNSFGEIHSFIPRQYTYHLVPLLRLEDYLKREHPDEVFCSLIHLNDKVVKASKHVGGIKVILRNNYNLSDVSSCLVEKAQYAYPQADKVIAQTERMKQELIDVCGISEDKIKVIDNPVDTDYIDEKLRGVSSPYPNDGLKHFCWIGRYYYIKGIDILIDAFAKAKRQNINISLYMIGSIEEDNPYYQSILEMVKTYDLSDKVHFIGFDQNPYKWMKFADGLIIPSRSEANSNVLKEAVYLGTPVINTSNLEQMAQMMLEHSKQFN